MCLFISFHSIIHAPAGIPHAAPSKSTKANCDAICNKWSFLELKCLWLKLKTYTRKKKHQQQNIKTPLHNPRNKRNKRNPTYRRQ